VSLLPIAGSQRPSWMPAPRARPHSATAALLSAFQGRSELHSPFHISIASNHRTGT